jgi:hypothetical protein
MVLTTAAYLLVTEVFDRARRWPIVGLFVESWQIYTQDMSRVYAAANTIYWLETATSSAAISSLMPKDPYATHKQVAVTLGSLAPEWLCLAASATPTWVGSEIAKAIARFRTWTVGRNLDLAYKDPPKNEWATYAQETVLPRLAMRDARGTTLVAETGTGKSTALVAALKGHFPRIWVLQPRIVLRDEYANPWWADNDIVRLRRGVRDSGEGLVVCTYGYARALISSGAGPTEGDLTIFDEAHEVEPDMGVVWLKLRGHCATLLLSATPRTLYCPEAVTLVAPIPRRFEEPVPVRLNLGPMDLWLEAHRDHPDAAKRALIVVAGINECHAIAEELVIMGFEAHALTRVRREVPRSGIIVATQIVDAGLNIRPPALVLIDGGERVARDKGVLAKRASDPLTSKQRWGRVAREAAGWIYAHPRAGTGPITTPYPTWTSVCGDRAARGFLFATLEITNPLREWPAGVASAIDPHMRIAVEDLSPAGHPLERDTLVALVAMWCFRCENDTEKAAADVYDRVQLFGWGEHENGVRTMIHSRLGSNFLVPRAVIAPALELMPFEVLDGDLPRRASSVAIREGKVTPR